METQTTNMGRIIEILPKVTRGKQEWRLRLTERTHVVTEKVVKTQEDYDRMINTWKTHF